jgi:3-isopropylmalate/(R)-2-methylmalate dehydratase large subunit
MAMTMTEKILARTSGQAKVQPGDLVVCMVDRTVLMDLNFIAARPERNIRRLHDPDRVAIVLDHAIPAPTVNDAENHIRARAFAEQFGIRHFYDVGAGGICHQIIAERGLALPGQMLACGDSHTCAAGAFNCAARGMGAETASILCTGQTWFRVGPTIQYVLHGQLRERVAPKDVFLHIAGAYGSHANTNVEFVGPGLANLTMMQRHTIATMCAEISAEFALFPADQTVLDYLASRTDEPFEPVASDPEARFAEVRQIDMGTLEPVVALPNNVVNNVRRVAEVHDVTINQAFVGSCANGKLEDIATSAGMIAGKQVAPGVRFIVTPGSQEIYKQALKAGYIETLVEAGAVVTNATCGACAGLHMGLVGAGERCITSSTRNFQGRMGSSEAEVFLASSESVTAAAITGKITDPRDVV